MEGGTGGECGHGTVIETLRSTDAIARAFPQVDVWALGCICYALSTFKFPFGGLQLATLFHNIVTVLPAPITTNYSEKWRACVMHCLLKPVELRPSAKQLVELFPPPPPPAALALPIWAQPQSWPRARAEAGSLRRAGSCSPVQGGEEAAQVLSAIPRCIHSVSIPSPHRAVLRDHCSV